MVLPTAGCGESLFLTVLLVLLVESMFVYNFSRSYYNSVQQTMMRRFSSINGQLKMYTGDTAQKTAANRSVALRRMVEQFADKDKYEFMLLDGYGGVDRLVQRYGRGRHRGAGRL
mgnify:CR=1 FL=1